MYFAQIARNPETKLVTTNFCAICSKDCIKTMHNFLQNDEKKMSEKD